MATFVGTYIHEGYRVDFQNGGSDVPAGSVVVQGALVGLATEDIPANAKGALVVQGVWLLPCGDTFVEAAGTEVYWDVGSQTVVATGASGANPYLGKLTAAVISGAVTCLVRVVNS